MNVINEQLDTRRLLRAQADKLVSVLRQELGENTVVFASEADISRHLRDHGMRSSHADGPAGVAYPRSTEQVAIILRRCNESRVPVVPQGGLTGMVGGALPVAGGLVLSLERMREVEEMDLAASTMTVQAGVPLQKIQETANESDLMFPLDLGARGSCLIGGNIATNAGGNRVLRYGMARDLVLGLEVVLADGTVLSSLNKMLKNNAGFDLKHLFVGSEGTLGVITRAVLRLFPKPRSTCAALCAATSYENVLAFLKLAKSRLGPNLSAYEVMWQNFYRVAVGQDSLRPPLSTEHAFYIVAEALGFDHHDADRARFQALIEEAFTDRILCDAAVAQSGREIEEFWAIRDASGELDRIFGQAINFDISIPIGSIALFARDCRARLQAALPGAQMLVFGHIADSNIHLSCKSAGACPAHLIEEVVYDCVRTWRGSVSAEHGIGIAKRDYLAFSRSEVEIALMRGVKALLDPNDILNPGKVLSPR